jgi:hypothetical protein
VEPPEAAIAEEAPAAQSGPVEVAPEAAIADPAPTGESEPVEVAPEVEGAAPADAPQQHEPSEYPDAGTGFLFGV